MVYPLSQQEAALVARTRIGIIGGGQLGLMTAEAARAMGYTRVTVLDPTPSAPASAAAEQIVGSLKDPAALRQLARQADILTYEIEHINAEALRKLEAEGASIVPAPDILAIIQNKYRQKEFLAQHDIPVAPFLSIETPADIKWALRKWGRPLVLKAKKDAYDGRGNARINRRDDIEPALRKLGDRELYAEQRIDIDKEIGLMIARNERGETAAHPVVQMIHARDICQEVLAPAPIDRILREQATDIAIQTIRHFNGTGIFGVEMFLDRGGKLWVNEIAPRSHNLGHFSIEACETSQFEQHLRAITGISLGATTMRYPAAVMINVLGERDGPAKLRWAGDCDHEHVFVHLYGKAETRIDRKMGHITVVGDDLQTVYKEAKETRALLSI